MKRQGHSGRGAGTLGHPLPKGFAPARDVARTRGTYLGVNNFVSAQRAGLAEAFAADFAHEGSGSGVNWHVAGEVIVSIKHLREGRDGALWWVHQRV